MSTIHAYLKASRLPSQVYIFFPLLLGQAIAFSLTNRFSVSLFIMQILFGLTIQLFIVYANDYADVKTDRDNRTYNIFSGGSRTLTSGAISQETMKKAIGVTVICNLTLGIILAVYFNRGYSLIFIGLALALLAAYSYTPLKLSYRGGGEFLQVAGVAVLLPLFAFYLHKGNLVVFPLEIILTILPINFSCALSTTLPDYPSDKQHQKRTLSVIVGPRVIKTLVPILNTLSFMLLLYFDNVTFNASLAIIAAPFLATLLTAFLAAPAYPGNKSLFYFLLSNISALVIFLAGLSLYFFVGFH